MFKDIQLTCTNVLDRETGEVCGKPFTWTKGEQTFMQDLYEKGKIPEVITPRRCKECRMKKKQFRRDHNLPR